MSTVRQQTGSSVLKDIIYLAHDKTTNDRFISELEKAGYRIRITSSLGETILCLGQPNYAALIVGPLVQAADKSLLTSEIRRRSSNKKVVLLHRGEVQSSMEADAVLSVQNGAAAIVRTLRKLLVNPQC
ncbi:MAG: hypothetical protein ACM3JB_06090 [Acidobacteriaceae bacterium]